MADITIINHGSLIGFTPLTEAAETWIAENIPEDAARLGRTLYVEARYAGDIAEGMADAGLEIN